MENISLFTKNASEEGKYERRVREDKKEENNKEKKT